MHIHGYQKPGFFFFGAFPSVLQKQKQKPLIIPKKRISRVNLIVSSYINILQTFNSYGLLEYAISKLKVK